MRTWIRINLEPQPPQLGRKAHSVLPIDSGTVDQAIKVSWVRRAVLDVKEDVLCELQRKVG